MTISEMEAVLIDALSEDIGVRVEMPENPDDRWNLLRALMNVRGPEPVSDDIVEVQDRLLSRISEERGITEADDMEFHEGIALWKGDITTLR